MAPLPPLCKHTGPTRLSRCEARRLPQVRLDQPWLPLMPLLSGADLALELEEELSDQPSVQETRMVAPELEPEACVPLPLAHEPHAHIFQF